MLIQAAKVIAETGASGKIVVVANRLIAIYGLGSFLKGQSVA